MKQRRRPFWQKVTRTETCWLWQGSLDKDGYGSVAIGPRGASKRWRAHRLAYIETYGPVGDGLVVAHRCDTPACVRPDHLEAVTQRENIRQCHARGRNGGQFKPGFDPRRKPVSYV